MEIQLVPTPEKRSGRFLQTRILISAWKEIPVPSNWEVHGYGTPFTAIWAILSEKIFPG